MEKQVDQEPESRARTLKESLKRRRKEIQVGRIALSIGPLPESTEIHPAFTHVLDQKEE